MTCRVVVVGGLIGWAKNRLDISSHVQSAFRPFLPFLLRSLFAHLPRIQLQLTANFARDKSPVRPSVPLSFFLYRVTFRSCLGCGAVGRYCSGQPVTGTLPNQMSHPVRHHHHLTDNGRRRPQRDAFRSNCIDVLTSF